MIEGVLSLFITKSSLQVSDLAVYSYVHASIVLYVMYMCMYMYMYAACVLNECSRNYSPQIVTYVLYIAVQVKIPHSLSLHVSLSHV